jgi:hypothetical protein
MSSQLDYEEDLEFEGDEDEDLEFESSGELEFEGDLNDELEFEGDEGEEEDELELEADLDDEEFEFEEDEDDNERELELEAQYADRLFELSNANFETELELDTELEGVLDEMERDFFFGFAKKLWRKAKRGVKRLARSKIGRFVKKLARPAMRLAKRIPGVGSAISLASNLARGNLKGLLGTLAKSGLFRAGLSAIPGLGPAMPFILPALKAAGVNLEVSDTDEGRKQFSSDMAAVSRDAFEYLARRILDPRDLTDLSNPLQAKRLAEKSLVSALKKAKAKGRMSFSRRAQANMVRGARMSSRRMIRVPRGSQITIVAS